MRCGIGLACGRFAAATSELKVTVSIGVAPMRAGEDLDLDGLLARVQEALDSARARAATGSRSTGSMAWPASRIGTTWTHADDVERAGRELARLREGRSTSTPV